MTEQIADFVQRAKSFFRAQRRISAHAAWKPGRGACRLLTICRYRGCNSRNSHRRRPDAELIRICQGHGGTREERYRGEASRGPLPTAYTSEGRWLGPMRTEVPRGKALGMPFPLYPKRPWSARPMATMMNDITEEYVVPSGVTAIRIEAESVGPGRQSSSSVTLQVRPGDAVRLRVICLPGQ